MRAWALLLLMVIASGFLLFFGPYQLPPMDTVQRGFRGLGMVHVVDRSSIPDTIAANQVPAPIEPVPPGGTPSSEVYENVQVLGDVDSDEFNRLMVAITEWVSPEQGCTYCHTDDGNFASDDIYTKVVSRRMLQMTRHINADWKNHVGNTGVTCYTCHRGRPVPVNIWFTDPGRVHAQGLLGDPAGQNSTGRMVGLTSLPHDPFTPFLQQENGIRVVATTALPEGNRQSIKQTEWTYGLMMHMSNALGVNCTYCHNSRSFMSWDQSNPARASAWYGIRMVRDLNTDYLEPLGPTYPPVRLGPHGDAPKANCTTCHQGAYKPLLGASMLRDYPDLGGPGQAAAAATTAQ